MNLFYDSINIKEKNRIHFNEFMLNVHKEIHRYNKKVLLDRSISLTFFKRNKMYFRELLKIEQEIFDCFAWMSSKLLILEML